MGTRAPYRPRPFTFTFTSACCGSGRLCVTVRLDFSGVSRFPFRVSGVVLLFCAGWLTWTMVMRLVEVPVQDLVDQMVDHRKVPVEILKMDHQDHHHNDCYADSSNSEWVSSSWKCL